MLKLYQIKALGRFIGQDTTENKNITQDGMGKKYLDKGGRRYKKLTVQEQRKSRDKGNEKLHLMDEGWSGGGCVAQ